MRALLPIILAAPLAASLPPLANRALTLAVDPATGAFTLTQRGASAPLTVEGRLEGEVLRVERQPAKDPRFGEGRRVLVHHRDGSRTRLELYRDLPFLLVRKSMVNTMRAELDLPRSAPARFQCDLGVAPGAVKTLGTGGLLAPDKNPGSYLFLAAADPATRRGVVAGWISQDRGSGVLLSGVEGERIALMPHVDYGHLRIPAGGSAEGETLAIGCFDDARIGLERYADAIRDHYKIRLREPKAVYCTWYTDGHGGAGDEASTKELAAFVARELKPHGLGVIQIDDRWQDGPNLDGPTRGFERARPGGPYPNGIAPVAEALRKDGLDLGLWWIPFGRNHADPAWKDRQAWFARWGNGQPARTKEFGGTCLDLTRPEAKADLASIAELYRGWGVSYFKMDGLWTGTATELAYINDGYVDDRMGNLRPLHDPSRTQVEAYRDGLKLLRRHAGEDVFFSGCCLSQNMRSMTAIGLVDAMRVGPDFNHDGQGIRSGPLRGSRLYFLNGKVWWNDPDPSLVRARAMAGADPACSSAVSTDQARLTTSWVSLTGQFFLCSDWIPALPAERLDILKRTLAHHTATARPVDLFDRTLANTWLVTDAREGVRRDVVGVFNFHNEKLSVSHACSRLGLDAKRRYHAFDFWEKRLLPDFLGTFQLDAGPNACRVIAVRTAEGHPVLLSTSQHVTQGMVDVTGERWSANVLSGTSRLIANDPCELRIAGTEEGGHWRALAVQIPEADRRAGVTATLSQAKGLVMVKLASPEARAVAWKIRFTHGRTR